MTENPRVTRSRPTGRGWAYVGAVLGGVVSVAANVAHSYVPPSDLSEPEAQAWSPPAGAVVAAVFWPIALLVAVEILARTAWPAGTRWTVMRYVGLLPVALVAAGVSYRHLSGLLAYYGEPGLTALVGPLAVDGLMVMATSALIATADVSDAKPAVFTQNAQNPRNPARAGAVSTAKARRRSVPSTTATTPASHSAVSDVAELVPLGRVIADRLAEQGRTLTRAALRDELRADGRSLSNARAGQLLALLKTDRTATADETPSDDRVLARTDHDLLMEAR